jgi:hypothetical protein
VIMPAVVRRNVVRISRSAQITVRNVPQLGRSAISLEGPCVLISFPLPLRRQVGP